jgi:hypothetical protein
VSELPPELQAQMRALAERIGYELEDMGYKRRTTSLLDMSYRQLAYLARQGYALTWLADRLAGRWAAWPDKPLVDVIKSLPRKELMYYAAELGKVGLHDLDELLLPVDPDDASTELGGDGGGR